jgi:uncharacterized membrane protein YoaK (UPF0700 family)
MKGTSTDREFNWSWGRTATILIGTIAGAAGAYYGQPLIHKNELAISVVVTAFSILAGFLIAIMTIMGDPSAFGRHSWRAHELSRNTVFRGLRRQQWLFVLYLATVCTMFAGSLVSRTSNGVSVTLTVWLERAYLFMAILAFAVSFRLPGTLLRIQMARHDHLIESRRKGSSAAEPAPTRKGE